MQLTSVLLIAGLFFALARSSRREELYWWSRAWGMNAEKTG